MEIAVSTKPSVTEFSMYFYLDTLCSLPSEFTYVIYYHNIL